MEKQLLCPFSGPSLNGVIVHHAVRFVHIPHMSITVLYYGQFHSFAVLITKITLCSWRMHVYQYVYISFVFPHYGCQVTLTLVFISPHFNFMFCQKFFGISFLLGLTVPQQFIFLVCKSSNNNGDEKKLSMQLASTFQALQ